MRVFLKLFPLISLLLPCSCTAGNEKSQLSVINGLTMGTSYSIKINKQLSDSDRKRLKQDIESILDGINRKMSTYLPDSELSEFNRSQSTSWHVLSGELYEVLEKARSISVITAGAFDITIGPVVNLWGFGPDETTGRIPSAEVLQATLNHTGYQYVRLQPASSAARKEYAEVYIDLSGIAKGYAADRIAQHLERNHIDDYMVEIGGEIKAKGRNGKGTSWRIGIEKPVTDQRNVQRIIQLNNSGMATSGGYRNYFELDGKRYSHTINPKTGKPVSHNLVSVTVLHDDAATADALATGILVMGMEGGYKLAERENIAAFFIIRSDDGFDEKYSTAFRPYLLE